MTENTAHDQPESIPRDESIVPAAEHPGEHLRDVLRDRKITAYRLSKASGLSEQRLGMIIRGERPMSAEAAIRIGRALGTGPVIWMNLQASWELFQADRAGDFSGVEVLPT